MKIALVTPAPIGSRSGNRHTAMRWAAFLRSAGHRVHLMNVWTGEPTDLLLALHARRSHESIAAFRESHPDRPVLLALTGTDVYRDIHDEPKAQASLRLSDRFIVLQPEAVHELPPSLRQRACVVYQSSASTRKWNPVKRGFRIAVIGHLRDEKDPMRAAIALTHIPKSLSIGVLQIGAALDAKYDKAARTMERREPRYRWIGSVSHAKALGWLASSHAMVISSRMEGGANVVSEAVRIGVPIVASHISGNIGLLGKDYPGYFAVGDDIGLAKLLIRTATDLRLRSQLIRHIKQLKPLFAPQNEASMLYSILRSTVGPSAP